MRRKTLIFTIIFLALLFLLTVNSYAGTQRWDSLNYDVILNVDGSMKVVETWNIKISNTNTLFKNFNLNTISSSNDIMDVRVSRVEDGQENFLEQIYEQQYHVDSGCFYALPIQDSKFEIAWNVGLDNSSATRTYKLYYTIKDAVRVYKDCSEFYWMFLGEENAISGRNVTGTIKLPKAVSDIEKIRVWGHGELSGDIERFSKDTIKFSLNSLPANSMLEVRVVTEENIYTDSINNYPVYNLDKIIEEETQWTNEANAKRNQDKFKYYLFIVINLLVILFFTKRVIKIRKKGEKIIENYIYPEMEIEYFREIPDELNATPARASFIMNYENNGSSFAKVDISKIFAGTILDLSLKGLLEFEPIDKNDIRIFLIQKSDIKLTEDETLIYDMLVKAVGISDSITTKELANYSAENYEYVYGTLSKMGKIVEKFEIESGIIDEKKANIVKKWRQSFTGYLIMTFVIFWLIISIFAIGLFIIVTLVISFIGSIACARAHWKNITKLGEFSEKGTLYKHQWLGLKKYMEDYSLLNEKKVPDIVLWEKFLVYATTFGISKKVIEQLKVVHPEMFMTMNNDYSNAYSRYTYWQIVSNNSYGIESFNTLSNNLERAYDSARSAYNSAHSSSSSSSGSGGGFSGGGGGRRRRWWLRRSLN